MRDQDLTYASISDLSWRLSQRVISPVELTRAVLDRASELDRSLNCFITLLGEEALDAARTVEREIMAGEVRGPLHGVPYTLKDLYATRGIRTTAGSKVLADWVPDFDATIVSRLKSAGAILIAKCNTSEFAGGPDNKNVHYGPAHNPWDLRCIPGGSSGGSGAAVAAGLGTFSMGSDTGGSVRIPAAACGVVGLKPTYGRVSKFGVTALSWSLDCCGPLARTVEDTAIVLEAIAGHDPRDPSSSEHGIERYSASLSGDLRGLRIAVPREHFWDPVDAEVALVVRSAISRLSELGARVDEISMPWVEHAFAPANIISWVESAVFHDGWRDRWASDYGPEMQTRLLIGRAISGIDYVKAHQARRAIVAQTRAIFERFDLLATPTSPVPAPLIADEMVQVGPVREPVRSAMGRLCRLGSLTGFPAVAVPCGFSQGGLPISLHLMAAPFAESKALLAAQTYQDATEWGQRRPPLS